MASSSCRTCIFDELAGNSLGDLTLEPVLGYHMLVPKVNSQEELFHWVSRTTNICYSLCLLETQSRHLIHGLVHSVDPDIVFAVDQEPRTDPWDECVEPRSWVPDGWSGPKVSTIMRHQGKGVHEREISSLLLGRSLDSCSGAANKDWASAQELGSSLCLGPKRCIQWMNRRSPQEDGKDISSSRFNSLARIQHPRSWWVYRRLTSSRIL